MARVGGAHHVLRVELLLGELRKGERAVLLRAARRERREADHEEVETRERDHVDGELAEFYIFVKETSHRVSLCFSFYFVSLFVCSLPQ